MLQGSSHPRLRIPPCGAGAPKGAGAGAKERRPAGAVEGIGVPSSAAAARAAWRRYGARGRAAESAPGGTGQQGQLARCRRQEPCGPCVLARSVRSPGVRPAREAWPCRCRREAGTGAYAARSCGAGVEAVPRVAAPTSARQCCGGHRRSSSATRQHASSGAIMAPGAVRPGCGTARGHLAARVPWRPQSPGAVPSVCALPGPRAAGARGWLGRRGRADGNGPRRPLYLRRAYALLVRRVPGGWCGAPACGSFWARSRRCRVPRRRGAAGGALDDPQLAVW